MEIREGFAGQRLVVVPRPAVREALSRPVTRRLLVTDCGYFPAARDHGRSRTQGAAQSIVIVCVSGSGWVRVNGVEHRIGAGTALILPAGLPHAYGAGDANPWTIWWCHLAGSDAAELIEETGVTPGRPVLPLRSPERAVALLDEIVGSLERDQSPARLISAAGAAWKLLTQLATARVLPERGDPLERAMAFLEERLDGTVRVAELARMVGISASHLSALFREATGGGVLAHHVNLRMAKARQLLDITSLPVADVASEVGYSDPFYFSRHFRRVHGVSPTEYRVQRKG